MDRKLFLVSDFADNFKDFAARFVAASGSKKAKIVFLMQGSRDWEKPFEQYKEVFESLSVQDFFPIYPSDSYEFTPEMISKLKAATGIFVGGGYTFRYIRAYAESELTNIILDKYMSGIPYAGLSAGAIITIRMGILRKSFIKPHFTQQNRFFELQKKLNNSKAKFALGLDDGIWLEVNNETDCTVFGKGGCYFCYRDEEDEFKFTIYRPGDQLELPIKKITE